MEINVEDLKVGDKITLEVVVNSNQGINRNGNPTYYVSGDMVGTFSFLEFRPGLVLDVEREVKPPAGWFYVDTNVTKGHKAWTEMPDGNFVSELGNILPRVQMLNNLKLRGFTKVDDYED